MGPKHGVARGVASSPHRHLKVQVLSMVLADSDRLQRWSLAHGVILSDDRVSLDAVDVHLDEWAADPSHHEHVDLGNDVGIYLGNVIVKTSPVPIGRCGQMDIPSLRCPRKAKWTSSLWSVNESRARV